MNSQILILWAMIQQSHSKTQSNIKKVLGKQDEKAANLKQNDWPAFAFLYSTTQ